MIEPVKSLVAAFVALIVLDGIWLGILMKAFYREALGPIARLADGAIAPIWSAALLVYVALAIGIATFVLPRANSVASAVAFGALFGLITYGVYDLTNYSTLAAWPLRVTLADMAWGALSCGLVAAFVRTVIG
jgi:uncharacterized membrane protein